MYVLLDASKLEEKNVLQHFLKDDCSEEELNQLHTWLVSDLDEKDADGLLLSIWDKTSEENTHKIDCHKVAGNIKEEVNSSSKARIIPVREGSYIDRKRKRSYSVAIVGSILAILFVGGYFLTDKAPIDTSHQQVVQQIEKSTSKGQRSSILLRDGSKVTLNSETRIVYNDNFGLNNRRIHLDGEAFFEVTKNKNLPFTVTSEHLVTRALGTSFNVRDYTDEADASIALATGEVKVNRTAVANKDSNVILKPNEQITIDKTSQVWLKTIFDVDRVLSWKENNLYFNEMNLSDIIKTLERWYNVKISVVGNGIEKLKYEGTGKFERQSLENILGTLGYTMGFESSVNEKQIIIKLTD